MKTLIVYASRHGFTANAALVLKSKLPGDVSIVDIEKEGAPGIGEFDTVIVGGSIHAGKIQKEIGAFAEDFKEQLLTKRIGLFLCCMYEGALAMSQFGSAYPEELRNIAVAKGLFGGAFDFEKMTSFEKAIVKKVAGVEASIERADARAIDFFAETVSNQAQ